MLNKEKYAKEIVELSIMGAGIALKDNKPLSCCDLYCKECDRNDGTGGCSLDELFGWANSEYEKSILDEAEKAYLSAVIKPFRNEVLGIKKKECAIDECIAIVMKDYEIIYLPLFKEGTMYQGMERDKRYTLEELGL